MPSAQAHRFMQWYVNQTLVDPNRPMLGQHSIGTLEAHSDTQEGREWIARSYLMPVLVQLDILRNEPESRLLDIEDLIFTIEDLIQVFPASERFTPPIMELRKAISELCVLHTAPAPEQPQPYDGPRPSRLERINNDSIVEESTDQWGMSGIR
jgi:hypothetical protein